ncbi:MAG: 5-formyltetrahydrofolate cyclo-ligase [Muribaculaceae bacterium]|nr:5-formyltetrahydrofolate cyclo-ligase [Muribaculaceae bacterium]
MNKKELRKAIKAKVAQLTLEEKALEASCVFSHIEKSDIFKNSKNIMLFASLPDEIPTHATIEQWAKNKNIYLPRVNGENLDIIKYKPGTLHKGSYNIMEPEGNDIVEPEVLDLIIVPGVAFDSLGNRLGRGKGFYDRFLSQTHAVTIAVCFNCQLVVHIPTEPHDMQTQFVVTKSFNTLPLNHDFNKQRH